VLARGERDHPRTHAARNGANGNVERGIGHTRASVDCPFGFRDKVTPETLDEHRVSEPQNTRVLHRCGVVALRCDRESPGLNERQTDTAVVAWDDPPGCVRSCSQYRSRSER
jgi:hypothetical protein